MTIRGFAYTQACRNEYRILACVDGKWIRLSYLVRVGLIGREWGKYCSLGSSGIDIATCNRGLYELYTSFGLDMPKALQDRKRESGSAYICYPIMSLHFSRIILGTKTVALNNHDQDDVVLEEEDEDMSYEQPRGKYGRGLDSYCWDPPIWFMTSRNAMPSDVFYGRRLKDYYK